MAMNHTWPSLHFSLPDSFKLFPDSLPATVPPPVKERSFRAPFGIDKRLFDLSLRPEIPVAIAITYVFSVFALNAYNSDRKGKPWAIAKTRLFQNFVVVHNIVLAIYSLLTFLAMTRALVHVWPGWRNGAGAAGIADAFCKLHGPRVLGDAARYNQTLNIWETKNPLIHLGQDGKPDPTDVGRLWNEGLAFWGWLFYVSKFYEVIDTLIILAKGKRSATLQTYHHAGAMLSMWAGIRYMSPPIWMFVWINSGIHALMYTYYTLSAVGVQVPQSWKRALTSMQIAQFVIGASFAAAHLFLKYDAPVTTPYRVANIIQKIASVAGHASSSATSAASAAASSPVVTTPFGNYLKKLLLRAAGEEGVAERVHNDRGDLINPKMEEKIQHFYEKTFETRYHTDWVKTSCLDTSGQAFAIYLNLFYLFPLTWLFGRFFFKAYLARGKPRSASDAAKQAYLCAKEAEQQTEASLEQAEADVARRASFSKKKAKAEFKKDLKTVRKRLARPQQETLPGSDTETSGWFQQQNAKSFVDESTAEQDYDAEPVSSRWTDSQGERDTLQRDSYDSDQEIQPSGWLQQQNQQSTRDVDDFSANDPSSLEPRNQTNAWEQDNLDALSESSWLAQTLSRRKDKIASLPPTTYDHNEHEVGAAERDLPEESSQWLQRQKSGNVEALRSQAEQTVEWAQHAIPLAAAVVSSQAQKAGNWLEQVLPTTSSEKMAEAVDEAYSADIDDSLDDEQIAPHTSSRQSKRVAFSNDNECAIIDSPEPSIGVETRPEWSGAKPSKQVPSGTSQPQEKVANAKVDDSSIPPVKSAQKPSTESVDASKQKKSGAEADLPQSAQNVPTTQQAPKFQFATPKNTMQPQTSATSTAQQTSKKQTDAAPAVPATAQSSVVTEKKRDIKELRADSEDKKEVKPVSTTVQTANKPGPAHPGKKLEKAVEQVSDEAKEAVSHIQKPPVSDRPSEKAQSATEQLAKSGMKLQEKVGQAWDQAKTGLQEKTTGVQKHLEQSVEEATPIVADVKSKAQKTLSTLPQQGAPAARSSSPEKKAGSLIPKMSNKKSTNDSAQSVPATPSKVGSAGSIKDKANTTTSGAEKSSAIGLSKDQSSAVNVSKSKVSSAMPNQSREETSKDKPTAVTLKKQEDGGVKLSSEHRGHDATSSRNDNASSHDQPAKSQDAILISTRALRPGSSESEKTMSSNKGGDADDTDAMGRSGIQVPKALGIREMTVEGEGQEDSGLDGGETATAALEGGKWHPPGVNGS